MKLYFATGNQKKCDEVKSNMPNWIELKCQKINLPEKQTLDLVEISYQKALVAFNKLKKPVIVDDTGFYLEAYNNFPWPLAKYVMEGIGYKGFKRLVEWVSPKAKFVAVISYMDSNLLEPVSFIWEMPGELDFSDMDKEIDPKVKKYFPYNLIFRPRGSKKLYRRFDEEQTKAISHRAKAIKKLLTWLHQKKV